MLAMSERAVLSGSLDTVTALLAGGEGVVPRRQTSDDSRYTDGLRLGWAAALRHGDDHARDGRFYAIGDERRPRSFTMRAGRSSEGIPGGMPAQRAPPPATGTSRVGCS